MALSYSIRCGGRANEDRPIRGTTRRFAALDSTSAVPRRGAADHSLLTSLLRARDTAGAPLIFLFVSRRKYS